MFHDHKQNSKDVVELAQMGSDVVAYMREMSAEQIEEAFPNTPELESGRNYWALFGADGTPLMLAYDQKEVSSSAFYSDLHAVLPN